MKRFVLFTALMMPLTAFAAAPVSPLKQEVKTEQPADLIKNLDDVLAGKFAKAAAYRPPLPLIQKAWEKQRAETKAGNKVFVWKRGKSFKVILREGMGTVFKLPDWDTLDQSVLADSLNFRQKEMNNPTLLYVEALTAGADTSLTIIGKSGNIYNFYLASESVLSPNISDQVVYVEAAEQNIIGTQEKSTLQAESITSLLNKSKPEWVRELKFDPSKVRHDLEMRGDKTLAPVLAFRDERFTYLDYGIEHDRLVWPVAYQVVDRVDQPVNVRKSPDGRFMIVETVNPITLRYGEKTVCIKREK